MEEDQHQAREVIVIRIDRTLDGEDTTARERGIVGRNRIRVQKTEAEAEVTQVLANLLLYWIELEADPVGEVEAEEEDRHANRNIKEVMFKLSPTLLTCIPCPFACCTHLLSIISHQSRTSQIWEGEQAW